MAKRAQGLPLNLIVLAIIAALVLVLIIAFTVGGAGSVFSKLGKSGTAATGDELSTVREGCRIACANSRPIAVLSEWKTSPYCAKLSNVDLNGDGSLADAEKNLKCLNANIGIDCANDAGTRTGVDCN